MSMLGLGLKYMHRYYAELKHSIWKYMSYIQFIIIYCQG